MKQMKKSVIALVLLTVAGIANAQTKPLPAERSRQEQVKNMTPKERGAIEAERMTKRLGLSTDQKASWQMAATERLTANRPIREKLQASITPEERLQLKSELLRNKVTFEKKVDSFLNADQKKKLSEQKQKRKAAGKQHRGKGRHQGDHPHGNR
jgi:hypothetical protein